MHLKRSAVKRRPFCSDFNVWNAKQRYDHVGDGLKFWNIYPTKAIVIFMFFVDIFNYDWELLILTRKLN